MQDAELEFADLQTFDDIAARVYGDPEMPHGTRELILTIGWLNHRDPARHTTTESTTKRLTRLLGRTASGQPRSAKLIADDAPRYQKPRAWYIGNGSCEGPRVRPYRPRRGREGPQLNAPLLSHASASPSVEPKPLVCGASARITVPERDMATGQITRIHRFCNRHKEQAERVRVQLEARGEPPAPIPNVGGFLPQYFAGHSLIDLYAECRPGWKPPIYGICRDEWPTATPTLVPKRPRLALVVSSGPPKTEQ